MRGVLILFSIALGVAQVQSFTISCVFSSKTYSPIAGTQYSCGGTPVYTGSQTSLEGVTGYHQSGKYHSDVLGFTVVKKPMKTLPDYLRVYFPNIAFIQLYETQLETVSPSDLSSFSNLQYFSAPYNKLTNIDGNLFKSSPGLKIMEFHNNQIQHVGIGLLSGLNQLQQAVFLSNPCVDCYAKTPAEIATLSTDFITLCPALPTPAPIIPTVPTKTTTPAPVQTCPIRCTLGDETDALRATVNLQEAANSDIRKTITLNDNRIMELERVLTQISVTPCVKF